MEFNIHAELPTMRHTAVRTLRSLCHDVWVCMLARQNEKSLLGMTWNFF